MDSISLPHTLLNAAILSLVLGVLIIGSLMYNARLWLQDYPKPIREKVPPLSTTEKRERAVLAVLVMGILFGGVILEVVQLRTDKTISFGTAYLHVFLILATFNLFDALVLDLFIITLLKPKFVILPGMEGMEYLLYDYRKQAVDFGKGMIFSVVASLPFALIAIL